VNKNSRQGNTIGATHKRIRTLVADDSATLLKALCTLLGTQPHIEIAGTARDGGEALRHVEALQPDLLVLDLNMPVLHGLEVTLQVRRRFPAVRIVIVTIHDSPSLRATCLEAGAHGFVPKNRVPAELMKTIDRAFAERSTHEKKGDPS